MADAIVSLILDQLKTTIMHRGKEEVKLLVGLEEEVEKLERNLNLIHGVLAHAEEKKRTDDLVKKWLDRLKEAAYDMEDALDEWRTALEMELRKAENQRKVPLLNFISCFSFHQLSTRRHIALNIKEINERLDEIVKEKDRYQLISKEIELPKRPESSSFVDVSRLCGRDGVKSDILSCLWGGNGEEEAGELIQTISIVGMGGLGKTALAQLIYNDCSVEQHFDNVIWVCVSDLFDEKKVARAIIQGLEKLSDSAAHGLESNPLQVLLKRISSSIREKKFLLVLDDVWASTGERWESLKVTFNHGAPGSRILVTTLDVDVAKMMGSSSSQIIHLEKLGEEECWLVLRDIAFRDRDENSCKSLEAIGRKIANRCKGLPLAAKTLGSLLKSKRTKQEWQSVLNSDIWKFDLAQKDIFAPLLLSYYDLPPPVRRCFLYCVVFPKDLEIRNHLIVSSWMAQGYLGSDGNADLESIGIEYFHILAARSFFQDFRLWNGRDIISVKMHDVVHDFAQYLAENEFQIKEVESDNLNIDSAKHRHLTVMVDTRMFPTSISGGKKLRTLQTFTGRNALTCEVLRSLFNQCRRLRLLDLGWSGGLDYSCKEIPKEIGKLIHLRYLSLANNHYLEGLPEALSNMYNLESLCLNGCTSLKQLPDWISRLINLRLLNTVGCLALTHYPKDIRKLTSLRALLGIIARADCNDAEEFSLADFGNLKHLCRVWLKVVGDSFDKEEAGKAKLENIQELRMYLAGDIEQGDIIEALDPPSDIIQLEFLGSYWF